MAFPISGEHRRPACRFGRPVQNISISTIQFQPLAAGERRRLACRFGRPVQNISISHHSVSNPCCWGAQASRLPCWASRPAPSPDGISNTAESIPNMSPPTDATIALPREIPPQPSLDVTLAPSGLEIFFTLGSVTLVQATLPIN